MSKIAPRASSGRLIADPRLASYLVSGKEHGVMNVPVERGLAFNAFTIGPRSSHPWYLAAKAFANGADERARLILEQYYLLVRPESVSDWHDLAPGACPGLASIPRHGWSVLPWVAEDPAEKILRVEASQVEENRSHGLDAGMEVGAKAFGPVADSKLEVEIERISSLTRSIVAHGFRGGTAGGHLGGCFLVANSYWRWLPSDGMHRVPVAAALGASEFTVRVVSVVRRDEAAIWPQVRAGLYAEHAALELFDRLLEGRPPGCTSAWIEWVYAQGLHEN